MKMPFGKYKGMDMTQLPKDYLQWIVANFDDNDIRAEARRILAGPELQQEGESKSLEERANEILGEKPVGFIRRGRGKPRKRF